MMKFEAHIAELRKGADKHLTDATRLRKEAVEQQSYADNYLRAAERYTAEADIAEDLARGFDLLADALATGQLTADQLRGIVNGMLTDESDNTEDGDESHFTSAQMDGEACTECGVNLTGGEPTVPTAYDFIEGQMFAHLTCVKAYEEPMTNRDVDPVNVDECDSYADAYSDTPIEDGEPA